MSTAAPIEAVARSSDDARRLRRLEAFAVMDEARLLQSYRLATLILRNREEAEDATQEAIAQAWSRWETLRDASRFDAWFDRILVNICRNRLRHARTIHVVPIDDAFHLPAADDHARTSTRLALEPAFARLTPDQRIIIVLRFWRDLPRRGDRRPTGRPCRNSQVPAPLRPPIAACGARVRGGPRVTGRNPDTENAIREWLADSAPSSAPASLRRTLEEVTSEPAAHARRRFAGRSSLLFAGRMVALVALAAIAASTLYLFSQGRPASTGPHPASPSASPSAPPSTATSASPTPPGSVAPTATETATAIPRPSAMVTQLPGSSWSLVAGALPFTTDTTAGAYQKPIFALPSGGFVAIVPTAAGETRVFESVDGLAWHELGPFPTSDAVVSDVAESAGAIIAVGQTQGMGPALDSAMVWTFDGRAWKTTELSPADGSGAEHVAAGPAGFLISGLGPNGFELWSSKDGASWGSVAQSGIPSDVDQPELLGNAKGYVVAQLFQPRVWQSTDGMRWTETYRAPALSGLSNYNMGQIIKAPDGSYRSFGSIYTGTGIASPVLGDTLIWTSPDMAHWTLTGSVQSPGWTRAVAAIAGGFVGAGTQPDTAESSVGSTHGPLGAWTSRDGKSWQPLAGSSSLPHSEVLSVVGDGTHAVIALVDGQGQLELLVSAGLK